jgi:hypothetical protein
MGGVYPRIYEFANMTAENTKIGKTLSLRPKTSRTTNRKAERRNV